MSNIDILEDELGLSIQVKWFTSKAYFLLLFATVWNGFIYVMVKNLWMAADAPFITKLLPAAHIAVGLFLIYTVAAMFLNKTYLEIDADSLQVHHEPLPWFKGKKNIPLEELSQVYVKEIISTQDSGISKSYDLRAILKSGIDQSILKVDHLEAQDFLTLEDQLERYLGIKDKYVKGQFGLRPKEQKPLDLDMNPIEDYDAEILKEKLDDWDKAS